MRTAYIRDNGNGYVIVKDSAAWCIQQVERASDEARIDRNISRIHELELHEDGTVVLGEPIFGTDGDNDLPSLTPDVMTAELTHKIRRLAVTFESKGSMDPPRAFHVLVGMPRPATTAERGASTLKMEMLRRLIDEWMTTLAELPSFGTFQPNEDLARMAFELVLSDLHGCNYWLTWCGRGHPEFSFWLSPDPEIAPMRRERTRRSVRH